MTNQLTASSWRYGPCPNEALAHRLTLVADAPRSFDREHRAWARATESVGVHSRRSACAVNVGCGRSVTGWDLTTAASVPMVPAEAYNWDHKSLRAPTSKTIARSLRRFDQTLVSHDDRAGDDLGNAPLVIVFRPGFRSYPDPCGLYLTDGRGIGHVAVDNPAGCRPGLLADTRGRVLAKIERRRPGDYTVIKDGRELATVIDGRVKVAGLVGTYVLGVRRRRREWAVFRGAELLATGRATGGNPPSWVPLFASTELTTAIWFRSELNRDQRAALLLVLLGELGPPDRPWDD